MSQKANGTDPKRKKRGMIVLTILMAAVLVAGGTVMILNNTGRHKKYSDAAQQLTEGYYQSALDVFSELGNYKDSEQYAAYCSAVIAGEKGDYSAATEQLKALSGFADSDGAANYFAARDAEKNAESEEDITAAIGLYGSADEFSDSVERANNLNEKLKKLESPEPTAAATPVPTFEPTVEPTAKPTTEPTAEPTAELTEAPEEEEPVETQTIESNEEAAAAPADENEETEETAADATASETATPVPNDTTVETEKPTEETEAAATASPANETDAALTNEPAAVETLKPEVKGVVIDTDNLNIHREASLTSDVLGGIPEDDAVTIESVSEGWAKVTTEEGITGYVSADYLDFDQTAFIEAENLKKAFVNADPVLYIHELPDAGSKLVRSIPDNTEVIILEDNANGWTKVSIYGYTGYVDSYYLEKAE